MSRSAQTLSLTLAALLLLALPTAAVAKPSTGTKTKQHAAAKAKQNAAAKAKQNAAAKAKKRAAAKAKKRAARAADRNRDGLPDKWEKRYKLSLKVNQALRDQDADGVVNRSEYTAGTNPRKADSDNDGVDDGSEDLGRVLSFDATTSVLKITDASGDTLSATVDGGTEIECVTDAAESPIVGPLSASSAKRGEGPRGGSGGNSGSNRGGSGENSGPNRDREDDDRDDGDRDDGRDDDDDDGHGDDGRDDDEDQPNGEDPSGDDGEYVDCGTEVLVAGAVVHEAALRLSATGKQWLKIEIVLPAEAPVAPPTASTKR